MENRTLQWILWSVAMAVFTWLTLAGHWDWLMIAMTISAVFWYSVVPATHSRRQ